MKCVGRVLVCALLCAGGLDEAWAGQGKGKGAKLGGGIVLDLHADTLYQLMRGGRYDLGRWQKGRDLDIPKLRRGGVGGQVFVMWVPPRVMRRRGDGWRYLQRMYGTYRWMLRRYRRVFVHASRGHQVRRAHAQGKIAALLAIEGLHPLEGRLSRLKTIAGWGLTYAGLTWNNTNAFAMAAATERRRKKRGRGVWGLTKRGRKAVRLLEKHRILVDLSHAGRRTFWDVARMARRPFVASHSNADRLCGHYRNLTDRQLRAIRKAKGVVGVNFYTAYLRPGRTHRRAKIADLLRHIYYMRKVAGEAHIALGSDYDGMISKPAGLEHIGKLGRLRQALLRKGFGKKALRLLFGENVLRVLDAP